MSHLGDKMLAEAAGSEGYLDYPIPRYLLIAISNYFPIWWAIYRFQTDPFILLVTSCSDSFFELVTKTWWIRRWTTMPKWKLKSTRKHLRCWMNLGNDRDSDCRYVTKSISNTALFSRLIKIPKTNRHQVRSDALGRSGLVAVSLLFYDVNPLIGTRASDVLLVAWLLRRVRWQRIIGGFILTFIYSFISFHWKFRCWISVCQVPESIKTTTPSSPGKTENVLPAYCNPPNPCPIGYTGTVEKA